jgi:hypothetical protein
MAQNRSILLNAFNLVRYNMRIIFGGKFIYFILAAVLFYLVIGTITALDNDAIWISEIYGLIAFPAILLAFYPTVFGIQSDADQRTLEIIFGIPNYRYKVWLVRYFIILIMVFLMLFPFAAVSYYLLISFPFMKMILHIMVLVLFTSSMGFCISTLVKNGNATAVIMVVFGLFFLILSEELYESKWNLFLVPFQEYGRINEVVFRETLRQNRLILGISSAVFLLMGLLNLQQREKFLR